MQGTYFLAALLIGALIADQQTTVRVLVAASLKIQIHWINLRLKFAAWRMYRTIVKMCKENGLPEPGPFRYTDLWDRNPLN